MTPEERDFILQRGDGAYQLLSNPVARLAFDAVRLDVAKAVFESEPKEQKAREDAYHLVRALHTLIGKMHEFASEANEIRLAEAHAAEEADEDNNSE
jgi:hypothetical protein